MTITCPCGATVLAEPDWGAVCDQCQQIVVGDQVVLDMNKRTLNDAERGLVTMVGVLMEVVQGLSKRLREIEGRTIGELPGTHTAAAGSAKQSAAASCDCDLETFHHVVVHLRGDVDRWAGRIRVPRDAPPPTRTVEFDDATIESYAPGWLAVRGRNGDMRLFRRSSIRAIAIHELPDYLRKGPS